MKKQTVIACLTLSAAALTSIGCVDPYYAGGGGMVVEPTYRPGYSVTALPSGYRREVISGASYYRHGDIYYRPQGRGYVVVESPHRRYTGIRPVQGRDRDRDGRPDWNDPRPNVPGGQVVRRLPDGYQAVTHRGSRYYRAGDVYYQSRGNGYVVVRGPY